MSFLDDLRQAKLGYVLDVILAFVTANFQFITTQEPLFTIVKRLYDWPLPAFLYKVGIGYCINDYTME